MMLVAAEGGHLTELAELAPRLQDTGRRIWVTPDSPQSQDLARREIVVFTKPVPPRGYLALIAGTPKAVALIVRYRPKFIVSTGSGVALNFLPLAPLFGAEAHYFESATRVDRPSFTGRWMERFPWVKLHTQHPHMATDRWQFSGSVFEGYKPVRNEKAGQELRSVVVTVGTMGNYGFERLIRQLVKILPADTEVLWQTGTTDVSGLGITAHEKVDTAELTEAIRDADLVIAHAGIGTAVTCLKAGQRPLLVARQVDHGEHVDDHQVETINYLAGRLNLAATTTVEDLDLETLHDAMGWRVEQVDDASGLRL